MFRNWSFRVKKLVNRSDRHTVLMHSSTAWVYSSMASSSFPFSSSSKACVTRKWARSRSTCCRDFSGSLFWAWTATGGKPDTQHRYIQTVKNRPTLFLLMKTALISLWICLEKSGFSCFESHEQHFWFCFHRSSITEQLRWSGATPPVCGHANTHARAHTHTTEGRCHGTNSSDGWQICPQGLGRPANLSQSLAGVWF